nr:DNA-directed RNA polymerase subunit delta [Halalkalibacterium ligniniphilum]
MSLQAMKKEDIQELSMIEIAYALMKEERQPFDYLELIKRVAELKGMTEEQMNARMGYLYTDLNIDGRFVTLGENRWGLKSWYPLEHVEEEYTPAPKKKAKAVDEEDDFIEDDFEEYEEDDYEDLEDELDEISNEEDEDDEDEFDDTDDLSDYEDDEDEFEDETDDDLK